MKTDMVEQNDKVTKPKGKSALKSKTIRKIVVILVLFLISSTCIIMQSFNSASINISAHFSSVIEGKNPDGSPFDINEVLSDEVLERASEKLGGKVDVKTLRKHLSISDNTSSVDLSGLKQKIVDGKGEMEDYTSDSTKKAPWQKHATKIKFTNINNGVTSIGNYAFSDCSKIISVVMPKIEKIGEGAFSRYSTLGGAPIFTEVTLPETLTQVGDGAFLGCEKLSTITIPESVSINR